MDPKYDQRAIDWIAEQLLKIKDTCIPCKDEDVIMGLEEARLRRVKTKYRVGEA